jgi:ectoine hydroxylase-related dioxygenase (phytanoyl-CoA dioxygenase family)
MDPLLIHEKVTKVLDRMLQPNYLISLCQAIELQPGEDAQAYHTDDAWTRLPRPRRHTGVNAFWALDDFTLENGATHMIPGSHKWGNDRFPDPSRDEVMRIVMPAGSVALFVSTIWLVSVFKFGRSPDSPFSSFTGTQEAQTPPKSKGWA